MVAFQRAVDWWAADMLELDVRLTKDGEVVVTYTFSWQKYSSTKMSSMVKRIRHACALTQGRGSRS